MIKQCQICKKEFNVAKWNASQKYCSKECHYEDARKHRPSKEEIERLYFDEGLSQNNIGKQLMISQAMVSKLFRTYKIQPRTLSDSIKICTRKERTYTKIPNYKIVRNDIDMDVSETDIAYVAGIIDGEGTIGFIRDHVKEKLQPHITVVNTHLPMLEFVAEVFNVGIHTRKKIEGRKQMYDLKVLSAVHIVSFLKRLLPYLKVKREQAVLLIKYCELRLNKRVESYNPGYGDEEWKMFEQVKQLNVVGDRERGS